MGPHREVNLTCTKPHHSTVYNSLCNTQPYNSIQHTSALDLADALCNDNGDVPLCGLQVPLQVHTKCGQLALQQLQCGGGGREGSVRKTWGGVEMDGRRDRVQCTQTQRTHTGQLGRHTHHYLYAYTCMRSTVSVSTAHTERPCVPFCHTLWIDTQDTSGGPPNHTKGVKGQVSI